MAEQNLKYKEIKLKTYELIKNRNIFLNLYDDILDFPENIEVYEKVIEPIEKVLEVYNFSVRRVEKLYNEGKKTHEEKVKEHTEILNSDVTLNFKVIPKSSLGKVKLSPNQIGIIKELIDWDS